MIKLKSSKIVETIRAVIFDVDGVFFPNTVTEGLGAAMDTISRALHLDSPLSAKLKTRSYYDGQAISLLRAIGLRVAFITNEKGPDAVAITEVVAKLNRLPSSKKEDSTGIWEPVILYTGMGGSKKVLAAEEFLKSVGISFSECAFMCDDLIDLELASRVAMVAAPITAEKAIRDLAQFISERPAGSGAVRDFVNFILKVRGIDPTKLSLQ